MKLKKKKKKSTYGFFFLCDAIPITGCFSIILCIILMKLCPIFEAVYNFSTESVASL